MGDFRMKPVFGEKANIESAKENGEIDSYDLLLLNNGEVGWINGENKTVINTPRTQNDTVTTNGMKIESGKTLDEIVQLFADINDNSFVELSDDASAERFVKYISPSFAIGTYYQIKLAVEQGVITHPTYVFYPEKNKLFFIDSDLEIHAVKGYDQLSLSLVDELPDENIEENTIYICGNAGYIYINSEFIKVFQSGVEEHSHSYNDLTDAPITNLTGEIGEEINLSELDDGIYSITGQYKIYDEGTIYDTSKQVLFILESTEEEKYITKIGAKKITKYTIVLDTEEISKTNYATREYIHTVTNELYQKIIDEIPTIKLSEFDNDAGFLTEDDIGKISDETIADLFI